PTPVRQPIRATRSCDWNTAHEPASFCSSASGRDCVREERTMAPTSTGAVATDASAAANPAAEPPGQVAVPPDAWLEDMAPIDAADWNCAGAPHLLERAGCGGTPDDIARLASMTPEAAVLSLVDSQGIENGRLTP